VLDFTRQTMDMQQSAGPWPASLASGTLLSMFGSSPQRIDFSAKRRYLSPEWTLVAILGAVVLISLLHYLTPQSQAHWHILYQRAYHIPILVGAVAYGLRGGLGIATLTALLYLPHIFLHWGHEPLYRSSQLAEIVLFLVFGAVAGLLIDRVRQEKEQHRKTAEELAGAYNQLHATFNRLRLVDRLSALGALSAGMAHEIRNPLGSITGAMEILESMTPEEDRRREFVEIVQKEMHRLSAIVTRQLDLVRSSPPERAPCDPAGVIESVAGLARRQAEHQKVEISVELAGELPTIEADEQGLRQVLLNLFLNAIQAMPRGGYVTVRADADAEHLRMVVEDEGPGLSAEAVGRAFDPFYTTKQRGTGLGLSIAFQIVDQHGGDLRVENRAEGGARFVIELPLATEGSA
jgi:two-component system sensor histidine kinase HydH